MADWSQRDNQVALDRAMCPAIFFFPCSLRQILYFSVNVGWTATVLSWIFLGELEVKLPKVPWVIIKDREVIWQLY